MLIEIYTHGIQSLKEIEAREGKIRRTINNSPFAFQPSDIISTIIIEATRLQKPYMKIYGEEKAIKLVRNILIEGDPSLIIILITTV